MPSLMPGMSGTKEAYGLSRIREDRSFRIPPKAIARYGMKEGERILLMTTHIGEAGLVAIRREEADRSVFAPFAAMIDAPGRVIRVGGKAYTEVAFRDERLELSEEALGAFFVKIGDELMSVKSTTISLSLTPKEIWMRKFAERGLDAAARNIAALERY